MWAMQFKTSSLSALRKLLKILQKISGFLLGKGWGPERLFSNAHFQMMMASFRAGDELKEARYQAWASKVDLGRPGWASRAKWDVDVRETFHVSILKDKRFDAFRPEYASDRRIFARACAKSCAASSRSGVELGVAMLVSPLLEQSRRHPPEFELMLREEMEAASPNWHAKPLPRNSTVKMLMGLDTQEGAKSVRWAISSQEEFKKSGKLA